MFERYNLHMKLLAWSYIVSNTRIVSNIHGLIGIREKDCASSLMIAKGCHFESVMATLSYVEVADISTQSCRNCCHLDHQ